MADRIAVLNEGRVEQVASPEELFDRPATRFVAEFIGTTNLFQPHGRLVSVRPERMRFLDPTATVAPTERAIAGVVRDVQFYGGISHFRVDTQPSADPALGAPAELVVAAIGSTSIRPAEAVQVAWQLDHEMEIVP